MLKKRAEQDQQLLARRKIFSSSSHERATRSDPGNNTQGHGATWWPWVYCCSSRRRPLPLTAPAHHDSGSPVTASRDSFIIRPASVPIARASSRHLSAQRIGGCWFARPSAGRVYDQLPERRFEFIPFWAFWYSCFTPWPHRLPPLPGGCH
jgi:hypothetical protein